MKPDLKDRVIDRATRTRNKVALHLRQQGAVSRDSAIAVSPGEDAKLLDRMIAFGAVQETADGRQWIDERRFLDFRKEGLASVLGYLALAGFAAAGALAVTG